VNGTAKFPPEKYGAIPGVLAAIVPAVKSVPAAERTVERCTTANITFQVDRFAAREPLIKEAVAAGSVKVVQATYDFGTGDVRFQ
jgi:hypothetical protein